MHQRQKIREAVVAALRGATDAADRVHASRFVPWRRAELPAISVYTLGEDVDPESAQTAPRELARDLELVIQGIVQVGDDVDCRLDDLALQIERAMDADPTFGGVASDSLLTSTEIDFSEEGSRTVGHLGLFYTIAYYTYPADPAAEDLPDFERANVRHNLAGQVHPSDEARDSLKVQE